MKVSHRFAGKDADARRSVTLRPPELPLPITFFFLPDVDETGQIVRWATVGFEVGTATEWAELTPAVVRAVNEEWFRYRRLAEDAFAKESLIDARSAFRRREGKQPLTDEFLRIFMADWNALGAGYGDVYRLAEMYRRTRTTIWRWRAEAKRRGIN